MKEQPGHRDRVIHRFGPWPLVPAEELLNLRQSLRQVRKLVGPTVASELLILIDQELHRRGCTPQKEQPSRDGPDTY